VYLYILYVLLFIDSYMVVFLFNTAIYVLFIFMYVFLLYVYVPSSCQLALFGYPDWGSSLLFLSWKANTRVKPAKTGHGPHSSKLFALFYVLFVLYRSVYCVCVCKCVLYYCHRVATQLQSTNISYQIWEYESRFRDRTAVGNPKPMLLVDTAYTDIVLGLTTYW